MKRLFLILFLTSFITVTAQSSQSVKNPADKAKPGAIALPDTTKKAVWIPSLVAGIGMSQIAFNNWVKGGDNSTAWAFLGDFHYDRTGTDWIFKNSIKLTYGRSKIGSGTYRTTDNDLYIENVAVYNVKWAASPFISNSIRSSVARGFDYTFNPEKETADFFDPGYVTQTIGFTYDRYSNIIFRLGLGFQEIFTNIHRQYTDPDNQLKAFKFETGIESVTDINYHLQDNILYSCKIRLFSQFQSLDVWDIRFDNVISGQLTKLISVNFTYLLIYEKAQSPHTQTKEGLQVGITYRIF
jgi:Protein of unknown function (DUF3078)